MIAPVLNGQVESHQEYFKDLASNPIAMPHYGLKRYSPKSFAWWLYLYRRYGLEGLKPGYRSDRGKSRRITEEMALKIEAKRTEKPGLSGIMLYDELVKDGVFTPDKVSLATFYRYLSRHPFPSSSTATNAQGKEIKRFAHQCSMPNPSLLMPEVIVLDEIHLAANKILEDLRLLFNFQKDSQNPFVLILAGQNLIRSRLGLNINAPLRQRLAVKYSLQGLRPEKLRDYVFSRLKLAGLHEDIFTPSALEAIYGITGGLPRLVNNLVTTCLICACGKKQRLIDEEIVYQAQRELEI